MTHRIKYHPGQALLRYPETSDRAPLVHLASESDPLSTACGCTIERYGNSVADGRSDHPVCQRCERAASTGKRPALTAGLAAYRELREAQVAEAEARRQERLQTEAERAARRQVAEMAAHKATLDLLQAHGLTAQEALRAATADVNGDAYVRLTPGQLRRLLATTSQED